MRPSGARVSIEEDRVLKLQTPESSRCERLRTESGARVAAATGLFRVPRIEGWSDDEGRLCFERLHETHSLRELLLGGRGEGLVERSARALAAIHQSDPAAGDRDVFWHGDYGIDNLLHCAADDTLAVIDWGIATWTDEPVDRTLGPPAHDIGIWLLSVFRHRTLGPGQIPDPEGHGARFIAAYREYAPRTPVWETLHDGIRPLLGSWRRHLRRERPLRWFAYLPSLKRLQRFIDREGRAGEQK